MKEIIMGRETVKPKQASVLNYFTLMCNILDTIPSSDFFKIKNIHLYPEEIKRHKILSVMKFDQVKFNENYL